MNNLRRAQLVAEYSHFGKNYDIYPYTYHCECVVTTLQKLGYDENICSAGWLHDTKEDAGLSKNKIERYFNEEIAELVDLVSDNDGKNREEKHINTYPLISTNWKATVLKIIDRAENMKHSKQFNQNKFKMYMKELPYFVTTLKNHNHPKDVQKAWDYLSEIVGELDVSKYSEHP